MVSDQLHGISVINVSRHLVQEQRIIQLDQDINNNNLHNHRGSNSNRMKLNSLSLYELETGQWTRCACNDGTCGCEGAD